MIVVLLISLNVSDRMFWKNIYNNYFRKKSNIHWVVNIPVVWIFQDSEYAVVMTMRYNPHVAGFWIFQDSNYAMYQGFEYAKLHRVLNMLEEC